MSDCIFCAIVEGNIPSAKVYEDEQVLAFLDITQVTKGHTLVIPKQHSTNLLEMTATEAEKLFSAIPQIARHLTEKLGANGMNLINNTNEAAGQTVFHTHVHLLPRFDEQDELDIRFTAHDPDMTALTALAQDLFLKGDSHEM